MLPVKTVRSQRSTASGRFVIFNKKFIIFNTFFNAKIIIVNAESFILNPKFIILNTGFSIVNEEFIGFELDLVFIGFGTWAAASATRSLNGGCDHVVIQSSSCFI